VLKHANLSIGGPVDAIPLPQEIARLLAAAFLGALIGLERERLDRGAGLRTHTLVATASALVMLVSSYGFAGVVTADHTVAVDPSRIAAQVVSGIGFLGAGTIILRRNAVRGLTTAASVWAVAAIGLASGAGMFAAAITCTVILLLVLVGLKPVEVRMFEHKRPRQVTIVVRRQPGQISAIEAQVRTAGIDLRRLSLEPGDTSAEGRVRLEFRGSSQAGLTRLAEQLQTVPGVRSVRFTSLAGALPDDGAPDDQRELDEE
jgi:putative Mg2+ transporter-C (MgtC) family protein